jgi:hypothetical protein
VLDGAVLVHVTGDTQGGELPHFLGVRDRTAEHENRQPALVELPDDPHQLHAARMRQPQVQDDEVDYVPVGLHPCQQLGGRLERNGAMTRLLERVGEAIPHERRVIGDEHGLPSFRRWPL